MLNNFWKAMGVEINDECSQYLLEEAYETPIKKDRVLSKLDLVILRLHRRGDMREEYDIINKIKDAIVVNNYSLTEEGVVFLNEIYREVK